MERWIRSVPGALLALCTLVCWATASAADVASLVAQVGEANLVAHVGALEGDRSSAAGQAAAAAYIRSRLESYGYAVESQPVAASENLIATRVGATSPGLAFVLGAHFDTVAGSPGADDDASGVAAVLEAARILADEPVALTVHFVFFALEEAGYQGSEAYAAALAAEGANVVGMISLDMIGYTCDTPGCQAILPDIPGCLESSVVSDVGDFIGAGANDASIPLLTGFLANAAAYAPELPVEYFTIAGDGTCFAQSRRSDHKSFWDEGYPAMVLGDGAEARNPNYHQSTDVLATLDTAFMASVTRAVVGHVAATVAAPAPVPGLSPPAVALLAAALVDAARRVQRGRRRAGSEPSTRRRSAELASER